MLRAAGKGVQVSMEKQERAEGLHSGAQECAGKVGVEKAGGLSEREQGSHGICEPGSCFGEEGAGKGE